VEIRRRIPRREVLPRPEVVGVALEDDDVAVAGDADLDAREVVALRPVGRDADPLRRPERPIADEDVVEAVVVVGGLAQLADIRAPNAGVASQ